MILVFLVPAGLIYFGLFAVGCWNTAWGFWTTAVVLGLLEACLFLEYRRGRPKFKNGICLHPYFIGIWSDEEVAIIQQFHIAVRLPWGGKIASAIINSARWLSLLTWIPLLLWRQEWLMVSLVAIHFFAAGWFAVVLDPHSFLPLSKSTSVLLKYERLRLVILDLEKRWENQLEREDSVAI